MNKGLICGIYESKDIGNCSNGGISEYYSDVLLIMEDKYSQVFEEDLERRPTVKLIKRVIQGEEYFHVEPIASLKGTKGSQDLANEWFMFGGSFIYSSDSRFPFNHPIKLFDRTETQEEYNLMGR